MPAIRILSHATVVMLVLTSSFAALAQGVQDPRPPTRDEVVALIQAELPPILTDNNAELVRKMLNPKLGPPLRQTFDLTRAVRAIFGRLTPTFAPDCQKVVTPAGELDPGECLATRGSESGRGAYTRLAFSKNLGFGQLEFQRRPVDADITPASLRPVQLSDEQAHKNALEFLTSTFGLSPEEIPMAPAGAKVPLPVKSLFMGFLDEKGSRMGVPIQKVVFLQRGVMVDIAPELPFVPAPGRAIVRLDDAGIREALVRDWAELVPHPGVDPRKAKSRQQLVGEIADELLQDNHAPIASMKFRFHLAGVPRGSQQLLLPAIQMSISPTPGDLPESQQGSQWTTAGVVHDFALVGPTESLDD